MAKFVMQHLISNHSSSTLVGGFGTNYIISGNAEIFRNWFFSKENKNFVKENEASFAIILIYFIFKMESSKLINYLTNMCPYDGAP